MSDSIRCLFDVDEVRRALTILVQPKSVFEVRALEAQLSSERRTGIVSGYFDNVEECVKQLSRLTSARGIYVTLNPLDPALLARRANRLDYVGKDGTTSDQHVLTRRWLLIDVDVDRPSGISAADAEKESAHAKSREIYRYLRERGWPEPIAGDSGNGIHLLFRVKFPPEDQRLFERLLTALANRFDDDCVKIDRAVHNPARIVRLYGTLAAKGDNTKDRPHRLSKIITRHSLVAQVKEESLRTVLTELEPATQKVSERRRIADQNSKADKSQIREMLAVIPKRPDYADWIKVVAAVGDALPKDDAIEMLCEWSPEEREGEYADKLKKRLSDVHVGTLIHLAKQHGWTPSEADFSADADAQDSERVELPPPPAPYVPPPLGLLPQEVRRYIAAGAKTFDVDVSFFLLPILGTASAAIGNTRSIRLKTDYIEPPILWTANIAPTGQGKSPVMQEATAPMRVRERELIRRNKENAETFAREFAAWDGKTKSERGAPPEKPPLLTCLMDDATIEAVAKRINDNPRGVLLAKDELSHWFETFDQYHDRAGADVSRWLSIWTGNFFALDRVTGARSYRIPNPRLSIASCVVPEVFGKLLTLDYFVRGLPARFLFATPTRNRPRTWIDKPIPPDIKAAVHDLFARLGALQPHRNEDGEQWPVLLGLDADARRIFADFYNECARRAFESGLREAAQWAKLSGYAARLALVGQLAHDPDAEEITGDIMLKACELARWFGNEAERIFASLAETPAQRDQRGLLEFIERRGGRMTVRDVITYYWRLKNQREKAEFELNMLAKTGFGKWEETRPDGCGRPTRVFQILRASAPAKIGSTPMKTGNCADAEATKYQKSEGVSEPETDVVSNEATAMPSGILEL